MFKTFVSLFPDRPRTFTVQFPNLVTVQFLLFIKSQFTTVARNIVHLTPMHAWRRLITDCSTLSEVAESCERFGSHQKRVAAVSAHLKLELNALWLLSIRTHQNLMNWGQPVARFSSRTKCLRTSWYELVRWKLTRDVFSSTTWGPQKTGFS